MNDTIACYNGLKVVVDYDYGCARLSPLPDGDEVAGYYEDDKFYSSHSPPGWLKKERVEHKQELWNSYYKYLMSVTRPKGRTVLSVLDWGCGAGWFLDYWHRHSKDVVIGLEPSKTAREFGPQPFRIKSTIEEIGGQVAVISLVLVLEHIVNPREFLREVTDKLKPGGRLLVVVPNEFNPLQTRANYKGFISPVHVNYFTPDSLRFTLKSVGLQIIHESSTFPMELFLLNGRTNYVNNPDLGPVCHNWRLRTERVLGAFSYRVYKMLYDRYRIGRELIFVAELEK